MEGTGIERMCKEGGEGGEQMECFEKDGEEKRKGCIKEGREGREGRGVI